MVQGPMGNCAKRPRHRVPKVGGLRGRSKAGRLGWTLKGSDGVGRARLGSQVGTAGG